MCFGIDLRLDGYEEIFRLLLQQKMEARNREIPLYMSLFQREP